MDRVGFDRCYFFGLTYAEKHLPMSEHSPAGYMTPAQRKLKIKIVGRLEKDARLKRECVIPETGGLTDEAIQVFNEMLTTINGDNPPTQTISRRDFTLWKKLVRNHLGFLPKILGVGEYGERRGRAHCHAVILNIDEQQAKVCADAWPHGNVEYEPVRARRVGTYISKDIVKSTWSKDRYIAANREPPFMTWPTGKGRGLAASQENAIYAALKVVQDNNTAERFEYELQSKHLARSFTVHEPPKSGPAAGDMGKSRGKKHNVRFGRTAYTRALARIDRNPLAQDMAAKVAAQNAHLLVETTNRSSRFYTEEVHDDYKQQLEKAANKSARAKRTHDAILERKKRGGSSLRHNSQHLLESS